MKKWRRTVLSCRSVCQASSLRCSLPSSAAHHPLQSHRSICDVLINHFGAVDLKQRELYVATAKRWAQVSVGAFMMAALTSHVWALLKQTCNS
jgi:hypothetical protein